jgi:hypothetical protein
LQLQTAPLCWRLGPPRLSGGSQDLADFRDDLKNLKRRPQANPTESLIQEQGGHESSTESFTAGREYAVHVSGITDNRWPFYWLRKRANSWHAETEHPLIMGDDIGWFNSTLVRITAA